MGSFGRALGVAALCGGCLLPLTARAAFETEVLTAAEKSNTLDFWLDATYNRYLKAAKITREWIQNDAMGMPQALSVKELRFNQLTQAVNLEMRVGLYHDLEFHIIAPIIIGDTQQIGFASGVSGMSTIWGSKNADDPSYAGTPRFPITEVPSSRFRSGFGDMTFGLAWSPFVDRKDESYPTVTLKANIIAPTGPIHDPTDQAALPGGPGGGVGLGQTIFDFELGTSRRMRTETPTLDPYMLFGASIPVANPKQAQEGMSPPASGRFVVGTEMVVYDDPERFQSYSFDLSFTTRYIGPGRTYSELSDFLPNFNQRLALINRPANSPISPDAITYADYANPANYAVQLEGANCGTVKGVPCGTLTSVDEYVQLQAQLALNLKLARYVFIRGGVAFEHDTDHFLTNAKVGTDQDPASAAGKVCNGSPCVGRVNAQNSQGVDERSPYYDPRFDAPGHRFRIEEVTNFIVFVQGAATF
jgi:hypothetical protein